jgi:hypothetical protein
MVSLLQYYIERSTPILTGPNLAMALSGVTEPSSDVNTTDISNCSIQAPGFKWLGEVSQESRPNKTLAH